MPRVDPDSVPVEWLVEKLDGRSFEAILRHHFESARLINVDIEQMVQDGIQRGKREWDERFAAQMMDSDEVWFFSNSKEDWASCAGRSGYAIVRNGKIIAAEITAMS